MSLPDEILKRADGWYTVGLLYLTLGIVLVAAGILASTAVSVFTQQLKTNQIKILSFIAAVSTALAAYFNPIEIGSRFIEAWRLLDSAILHHKTEPAKYDVSTVVAALDKGEDLLSRLPKFAQRTSPAGAASAAGSAPK
ncbi:hypothetical protein [Pelomonas sp. KK5]|uniref:hypothetical protein n=1 Tax=Pelomonas sp. KK5 TaxID=1855730 RepID=UPI00097BCC35|nr:hypothetical protein [Pelomonas sp. KK5]